MKHFSTLILISCILFSGCSNLTSNPNAEAALTSVTKGALDYTQGNTGETAVDAVQAAAYLMRTIQGTPVAGNPTAVANAAGQAGAGPLGDTLANAVSVLTQSGMSGSAANEAIAKQLDKATAQKPIKSAALHWQNHWLLEVTIEEPQPTEEENEMRSYPTKQGWIYLVSLR